MTMVFDYARRPFQSDPVSAGAEIAAWERSCGITLPTDYRSFMIRYNGGSLRPYALDLFVPDSNFDEKVHALDYFYDWNEVDESSEWRIESALRNIPPNRLAIGSTVSDLTITLCIAKQRFGAIEAWVRDTFNVWGEGANTQILPLADSFSGFLAMLHDSAEVYHSFWSGFGDDGEVAQSVTLP